MTAMIELMSSVAFGGHHKIYSHVSEVCKCIMKFSIYIPPAVVQGTVSKVPVLYFFPGRRSTVENFYSRSVFQKYAAEKNLVVVAPDSSPRDTGIPGESDDNINYGHSAGFYMDAVTPGWKDHYKMFTYVTEELISVVESSFGFVLAGRRGLMGRSMGGHGALLCAFKRPDLYSSFSCFFPVCNGSSNVSAGTIGPYETYLGTDEELWKKWDPCELMKAYEGRPLDILVHAGTYDRYWEGLKVWQLVRAAHGKDNINLYLKIRGGHGHNDEFVASIMEYVVDYHANILNQ